MAWQISGKVYARLSFGNFLIRYYLKNCSSCSMLLSCHTLTITNDICGKQQQYYSRVGFGDSIRLLNGCIHSFVYPVVPYF